MDFGVLAFALGWSAGATFTCFSRSLHGVVSTSEPADYYGQYTLAWGSQIENE